MPEPNVEQPGGTTPPAPETTPPADPTTLKVDGDKIPEKFRGKTVADIVASYEEAEAAKVKAEQETSQWRKWGAHKLEEDTSKNANTNAADVPDLTNAFTEDQQKAITSALDKTMKPLIDGLGSLMKEVVKSSRPDFTELQEKATEYYNAMDPAYRVHPDYGWDYAYRMAKADQLKTVKPVAAPPPLTAPTSPAGGPAPATLTAEQQAMAKQFHMTDKEYAEFQTVIDVDEFIAASKKGK
jgi:hypothetical protein